MNIIKYFSLTSAFFTLFIWNVSAQRRIHKGRISRIEQFPYMAIILDNYSQNCGGSILSEYFILTASHCVQKSDLSHYQVVYGTATPFFKGNGVMVNVSKFFRFPHPLVDAAIMETSEKMIFSKSVQPVVLDLDYLTNNYQAIISGWGLTQDDTFPLVLLSANMTLFDWLRCNTVYKDLVLYAHEFCGKSGYLQGPCDGDSGSPVVGFQNRRQIGIFIRSRQCADPFYPDKFTHVPWIKDFIDLYSNSTAIWKSDSTTPYSPPDYIPTTTEEPKKIQQCKCKTPYYTSNGK